MYDFAWLIEHALRPGPLYYAGVEWSTDHMKAIRYSRREDAQRAIMGLPDGGHLIGVAVQHGWSDV